MSGVNNIFDQVHHVNICHCQLFGHLHRFWSYSFGHLDSVKRITLFLTLKKNLTHLLTRTRLLTKPVPYFFVDDKNRFSISLISGKAYDASKVLVSSIPWGTIGKPVDFTVDASKAGAFYIIIFLLELNQTFHIL